MLVCSPALNLRSWFAPNLCFLKRFFKTIGQNGRPGRREAPWSTSLDETSRIKSVWGRRRQVIFCDFLLCCCRKELMACVRQPREKLCASAFHPSKTRKKGTKKRRLRRPLCVRVLRVLEGWNAPAHSFSRGFRTRPINYCPRQ